MANIVLVTKGTGGDLFPFLRIGQTLKARGHVVVLVTHWYSEQKVLRSGLNFAALDNPEEVPLYEEQTTLDATGGLSGAADEAVLVGNHAAGAAAAADGAAPATAPSLSVFGMPLGRGVLEYESISGQCRPPDTILVVNYIAFFSARHVADRLGVPLVAVFTAPSMFPQWVLDLPFFDELYAHVGGDLNRIRAQVGLAPVRDWRAWLTSADALVGLWPEWFAAEQFGGGLKIVPAGFPCDVVSTGELPSELGAVLDSGAPPLLITHGTSIPAKSDFFTSAVEACRLSELPALLVCAHERLVPQPLPEGVTWFKYLPFDALMPRMSAIIHHGGIGTCGQAMAAGLPQVILALGYDRADNAARLHELGVAEALTPLEWRPDVLAGALRRLLALPGIKPRCADYARRLRHSDYAASASEVIETLVTGATRRKRVPALTPDAPDGVSLSLPEQKRAPEDLHALFDNLSPARRALLKRRLKQRLSTPAPGK
jgi:UDP:flavonoid glycosyltransferase YjiC (YdhE family)